MFKKHEINHIKATITVILLPPLIQEGLSYVHEVLLNCLSKLAQEKRVVRWTDRFDMTIAVDWDEKPQTNKAKS